MTPGRLVAIDALLECTGPGVFVAHFHSPVCVILTRTSREWVAVDWETKDDEFGLPRQAYRSRTRRRIMETAETLVNFWRAPVPGTIEEIIPYRLAPSLASPAEREHFER